MVLRRWLWYALASMFCWGIWGFLVKLGSGDMNPSQLQILFVAGMLPPVIVIFVRSGFRVQRDRLGVLYGLLNGILATAGMLAFYAAMARGKASVVGPLTAVFPLFTVLGAILILRERLNRVQAAGIAVALAAVLVFAR
jgi:bacterial/archaeal transporter family protein